MHSQVPVPAPLPPPPCLPSPCKCAHASQFLSSDGVQLRGGDTYRMDWQAPPPCNPLAFWAVQVIDLNDLTCARLAAGSRPGVGSGPTRVTGGSSWRS